MSRRGDFTNNNAFFWHEGTDLSAYAGTDTGYTPNMIDLTDSTGKKALGYIGAAGAGETLGSEVLLNGSFETTANWTAVNATIASIPGGVVGNCLELTRTGGASQHVYQQRPVSSGYGKLFRVSRYLKSGTSGDQTSRMRLVNIDWEVLLLEMLSTSTPSWTEAPGYATLIDDGFYFVVYKMTSTPGTMLFDEASVRQVTEPPSTAVHIVSSLNGTTRAWASIESGFDVNSIVSYNINISRSVKGSSISLYMSMEL